MAILTTLDPLVLVRMLLDESVLGYGALRLRRSSVRFFDFERGL